MFRFFKLRIKTYIFLNVSIFNIFMGFAYKVEGLNEDFLEEYFKEFEPISQIGSLTQYKINKSIVGRSKNRVVSLDKMIIVEIIQKYLEKYDNLEFNIVTKKLFFEF